MSAKKVLETELIFRDSKICTSMFTFIGIYEIDFSKQEDRISENGFLNQQLSQ